MMNEYDASSSGRVYLIGAQTIQSRCLIEALNTHVPATLHDSLDEALSMACLNAGGTCVLLVDVTHIPVPEILGQSGQRIPANAHTALFNVSRAESSIADCVLHGVRGVFFEDNTIEHMIRGLLALLDGSIWIARETLLEAATRPNRDYNEGPEGKSAAGLTRREREILGMLCVGATNKEISTKLFVSTNTVKTHIYKIYKKINVPNRMQAALWAAKHL